MTPKLRAYLDKTKILDFPIALLTIGITASIFFENVKLGATFLFVLMLLVSVRYASIICRRIRYMYVKNRHTDNLLNFLIRKINN